MSSGVTSNDRLSSSFLQIVGDLRRRVLNRKVVVKTVIWLFLIGLSCVYISVFQIGLNNLMAVFWVLSSQAAYGSSFHRFELYLSIVLLSRCLIRNQHALFKQTAGIGFDLGAALFACLGHQVLRHYESLRLARYLRKVQRNLVFRSHDVLLGPIVL